MYKEALFDIINEALIKENITMEQYMQISERILNIPEEEETIITEQVVARASKISGVKAQAIKRALQKRLMMARKNTKLAQGKVQKAIARRSNVTKVALKKQGVGSTPTMAPHAFKTGI